jgi:DNA-binding transcriptional LysR family regulator
MSATLAQMKAVEALSRTGKFSAAAEELGISQPTVSSQVQAFEQLCKRRIFQRNGHSVRVAAGAHELIAKIRVTLKCLNDVNESLSAEARMERGTLSIGFSAHRLIMPALTAFVRRYPGIHLNTQGGPSLSLFSEVLSGDLDVAAISMPLSDDRLFCEEILRSRIVIYGPKGHRALQGGTLTLGELARERLVLWNRMSGTRSTLEQAARQAGVTLNCVLEVATLDVAYASAAAGIGLGCAIEGEVQADSNIDVAPLVDPELSIGHYLVCLPECREHAAVGAFFDIARAHHGLTAGSVPGGGSMDHR